MDEVQCDLAFNIAKAESLFDTQDKEALEKVADDMFHNLYARMMMAAANAELCTEFNLAVSRKLSSNKFGLPEAAHASSILWSIKRALDKLPGGSSFLQASKIKKYQQDLIKVASQQLAETNEHRRDDFLGYRHFTAKVLSDKSSSFYLKYGRLFKHIYVMPPGEVGVLASEKYLSFTPQDMSQTGTATDKLPFVDMKRVNEEAWVRQIILDNRLATLAKLEGKFIGQLRREESGSRPLIKFCREKKCVCSEICSCAEDCTHDVERVCPCAERMLRLQLFRCNRQPHMEGFAEHSSNIAKLAFEELTYINRETKDSEIGKALDGLLHMWDLELRKQLIRQQ